MLCSTTTETSLMADQTTCCNLNSTLELIGLSFIVFLIPLVVFLYVRHLLLWDLPPAVPAHQRPKAGLDPSAIAALPSFAYRHASVAYRHASAADASSVVECAVCLSAVEEGETVRLLPACEHTFHVECIDLWLLSNATCPVCRAEAEPRKADVEEGRAAAASSSPLEACGGAASQGKRIGETSGSSSSSSLLFLRGEGIKDLENNL